MACFKKKNIFIEQSLTLSAIVLRYCSHHLPHVQLSFLKGSLTRPEGSELTMVLIFKKLKPVFHFYFEITFSVYVTNQCIPSAVISK